MDELVRDIVLRLKVFHTCLFWLLSQTLKELHMTRMFQGTDLFSTVLSVSALQGWVCLFSISFQVLRLLQEVAWQLLQGCSWPLLEEYLLLGIETRSRHCEYLTFSPASASAFSPWNRYPSSTRQDTHLLPKLTHKAVWPVVPKVPLTPSTLRSPASSYQAHQDASASHPPSLGTATQSLCLFLESLFPKNASCRSGRTLAVFLIQN